MSAGRPPKPAELRVIEGNPGKRPIPDVPAPVDLELVAPDWLKGEALVEWDRCIRIMKAMGTLGAETRAALAIYCRAWQRLVEAEAHVAQHGELVAAPRTGVPMHNPYLAIANQAAATILKIGGEFGFSPAARVRLALPGGDGARGTGGPSLSPAERWFANRKA